MKPASRTASRTNQGAHRPTTRSRATSKPDVARTRKTMAATGTAPSPAPRTGLQLHTADGSRKYVTAGERDAFLRAAEQADRPVRTLCMTLPMPAAGCPKP